MTVSRTEFDHLKALSQAGPVAWSDDWPQGRHPAFSRLLCGGLVALRHGTFSITDVGLAALREAVGKGLVSLESEVTK